MPPKEKDKDKTGKQSAATGVEPKKSFKSIGAVASASVFISGKTKKNADKIKISIWPEWTENEMNSEKWDVLSSKGKSGKASATPGNLFTDPDGLVKLPYALEASVDVWKRPSEVFVDRGPVVVEGDDAKELDLFTPNVHLMDNEVMRSILSQLSAIWESRQSIYIATPEFDQLPPTWAPWNHIHPRPKGGSSPVYNPGGKYCVRLFWMGCWRKIVVDDLIPVSSSGRSLLPSTSAPQELWPAIITKAILKVFVKDSEEASVVTLLTGWLPQTLEVAPGITAHQTPVWRTVYESLPLWQRESPPLGATNCSPVQPEPSTRDANKDQTGSKRVSLSNVRASAGLEQSPHDSTAAVTLTSRNVLLLANYTKSSTAPQQPLDARAEVLKKIGLPSDHPHPVLLTMVRAQELVVPEKKAPEPVLQQPYYLGLLDRKRRECDPPVIPTPPPRESKYLQIHSLLQSKANDMMVLEDGGKSLKESVCNHLESVEEEETKNVDTCEERPVEEGEEDGDHTAEDCSEEGKEAVKNSSQEASWVQWDDFTSIFHSVVAFYRPEGFKYREVYEDLSDTTTNSSVPPSLPKGKNTAVVNSQSALQSPLQIYLKQIEKNFLFVDSVDPVELVISFSSLSHWKDTEKRKDSSASNRGMASTVVDSTESQHTTYSGSLCLEKYSWRNLSHGQPLCQLKTKSIVTSTLKLPEGRHCFRLVAATPHGYHVDVMSNQQFVLTDELTLFEHMTENSKRFTAHAERVVSGLVLALQRFPDLEFIAKRFSTCLPVVHHSTGVQDQRTQILYASMSHSLWTLQRTHKVPYSAVSAVRTVLRACLGVLQDSIGGEISKAVHALRNTPIPESWHKREPSMAESAAVTRLQRVWRRHLLSTRTRAFVEGSKEFEELDRNIHSAVEVLKPLGQVWGSAVFNTLFQMDPSLLENFPFFKDECSRAFFKDYEGSYKDLAAHSWAVICREVFHFEELQFVRFQTKIPFTTCCLRVFDNDSGKELPSVLHWTAPHVYSPNKHGYSVVVEGWSGADPLPSGSYLLRILSSSPTLPLRSHQGKTSQTGSGREKLGASFTTNVVKQYYLPDRDLTVFRYSLRSQKNALVSARVSVSKSSAVIKMEILDHDCPVVSAEGRGSCVLPAYLLRGAECQVLQENTNAPVEDTPSKHKHHKYVLRAMVLKGSWPVSESAWQQMGEEGIEKEESRPSTSASEKPPSGRGGKGSKSSKSGAKGKGSQHQQQNQLDPSKPHWTLHMVTSADSSVEVVKDTEREDELRSMTQAWEAEQPGRLRKGMESRKKFLESRAVPKEAIDKVLHDGSVPLPPRDPLVIPHVDTTEYRIGSECPRVLTSEEMDARTEQARLSIQSYRSRRNEMLKRREEERIHRNDIKSDQLTWAEDLNIHTMSECDGLNVERNAIREKALEIKRKAEAEAAALQQQQQESSGRESKAKGKSGKGKKK